MFNFIATIHIIASVVMIVFILLQDPKGGAMGMFGGGSSSLFGSTGANQFLLKVTKWTAVVFACTSIYLAALSSQKGPSVLDQYTPEATQSTPPATATEDTNPANKKEEVPASNPLPPKQQ